MQKGSQPQCGKVTRFSWQASRFLSEINTWAYLHWQIIRSGNTHNTEFLVFQFFRSSVPMLTMDKDNSSLKGYHTPARVCLIKPRIICVMAPTFIFALVVSVRVVMAYRKIPFSVRYFRYDNAMFFFSNMTLILEHIGVLMGSTPSLRKRPYKPFCSSVALSSFTFTIQ